MKKVFAIFFVLLIIISGCSVKRYVRQTEQLIDDGKIESAKEKIQMAIDTTANNQWARTYLVYGKLAQTAGTSKKKKERKLFESPLQLAYDNYIKAQKLDKKGKFEKSLSILLPKLSNDFINKGVESFKNKEYKDAMLSFEYACKITRNNIIKDSVDAGIIYNAGLSAYKAKIYDNAIKHFAKCKQMNYGGPNLYMLLKDTYISINDSASALHTLKEAFDKFPDEDEVLYQLVNYYITADMNNKALDLLEIAKEKDPDNAHNFFAEGLIYDRMGKINEAKSAYLKSIDLDPDFFTCQYNLGALIFNQGVTMIEEANKIIDNEKYKAVREKANKKFQEALPYLEKAHQLNERDIETMETLKLIYYRLKMMDKHAMIDKELQDIKR